MDVQEVRKLDAYLKKLFGNARIRVVPRPKKEDSAEVYVGDEFVGDILSLVASLRRGIADRGRTWRAVVGIERPPVEMLCDQHVAG